MNLTATIDAAVQQHASNDDYREMERQYVLHSWTVQSTYNAPVVVGGQGATYWDLDGRRYLDFCSQAMCSSLGHQHPRVVEAIQRQAAELCFVQGSWASVPRARLAKLIAEVSPPGLLKTFFTLGGAEANENAIKFARWFTGKQKIITRYRSYHGASSGAITLGGDPRRWAAEPGIPGVVRALDCYCYRCPFGLEHPNCGLRCADHIDELIQLEGPDHVAAVMVEPIVGSNGILVPPDGYLERVREICTANGVLLIADEVMTGFGRTGAWFACDHWKIRPDIMTMAKGITGAMVPLGGVVISQDIAGYFDNRMLFAGLTYLGHPLACAAGVAAVETYKAEGLVERSRVLGERMLTRLHDMQVRHPSIGEVRGKGLFATAELVKNRRTREPMAPFNGSSPAISRLVKEALARGVSFSARFNFFIFAPPLVITDAELDHALDLLDELLAITDAEVRD